MSADPFANTTTVKNILQHIISPKIVSDGNGGYVTRTDLVNVDNLLFTTKASTAGTGQNPLTSQCGSVTVTGTSIIIYHSRVTGSSIIFAVPQASLGVYVTSVIPTSGSFTIQLNNTGTNLPIGWFIASF
jgi:hypothetical protein